MSRLQKKKPQSEKRKRVAGTDETVAAVKSTAVGKSGALSSASRPEKPVGPSGADNFFTRTAELFREVKIELKKVVWPTRKQTTGTTVLVVIFVFVVAVFLGVFDYSLSRLVQIVLT